MSNIQRAADKVRQELLWKVRKGEVRYANIDKCIGMRHYSNDRYSLEVEKVVKDKRFNEFVSGGTPRNIDEMLVAAYEARKRVYRKAEAYRQKLETTPAPKLTTPAPQLTTPAPKLTTPAPTLTTPAVDTVGKLDSSELAKLLAIGISALAGGMIGWIIGGAL
jgi:hypothetical protein